MPAIKGSNVRLLKGDGASTETFTILAGSRNVNYGLSGNEIDTTTADDINEDGITWRTYIGGIIDFQASLDGLLKDADAFDELVTARLTDEVANYQVEIEDFGTFEGPMRVTQLDGTGQFDDAAGYSISVRAAGAVSWTKATS